MPYWECITFESAQIPSTLGFKTLRDGMGYLIGYKESSHVHSTLTSRNLIPTTLLLSLLEPNHVYLLGHISLSDCA